MVRDAIAVTVEETRVEWADPDVEVIEANTQLRIGVHRVVEVEPEEVFGSCHEGLVGDRPTLGWVLIGAIERRAQRRHLNVLLQDRFISEGGVACKG